MPTFSYKGYDFDVAHQPTEQEFAQMSAYVDTLPPKEEKKKADFGTAFKKSLAGAANAIESAISLPAGGLAGMMGFEDDRDEIFGRMDANRAAREQWANPEKLETSLGQDVAATALTLPAQIPAMLGQAAEKGMDLIKRGEPLSTAIPATVADAGLNALGMGPMAPAKTFLGRAAIGAAGNTSMGAVSDALTQLLATQEETKKAYNPYDARRRAQEALVGGVTQGAMGERPKAKTNTPRLQGALDDLVAPKPADVKKAPSLEPEQLRLFDQFDERSPVSPYQTEMAPVMRDTDLEVAKMKSDGPKIPLGSKARKEAFIKAKRKTQGGAINVKLFDPEYVDQKRLSDGTRLTIFGGPGGPHVRADIGGKIVGDVYFENTEGGYGTKPINANLVSEDTSVVSEFRRKGIAAEMYQFASEQGADIVPSMEQTPAGKAMWAGFEKYGVSNGKKIPFNFKKQGGAVAPDVFLKDFPDFVSSKIKDASGQLKALFRGVRGDYEGPERPMLGMLGEGIYLTESKTLANNYANGPESGRHVKQAYVDMKNPFEIEMGSPEHRGLLLGDKLSRKQFSDKLKASGFDGVVVKNGGEMKEVMAFAPEQVQNAFSTPSSRIPKGQRGGLKIDWQDKPSAEVLARVPGIKEKLKNLIPNAMTADEAIVAAKGMKDVDQNIAQKAVNVFTKGGLYQAEKTGNPVIKFVVDKMLNADRLARADIRDYIHDSLAPAMRDLSTVERTEIATVLNQADLNKVEVTPEFLQKHGFSEKQIAFAQAHKQTMDAAFERINAARAAAGKDPIDKRVAYSAMNATGDFRKRVYTLDEDGNKVVVGVLGAKTKWGLASIEKKMRASNPEYIIESETRYGAPTTTGRGGSTVVAIQQALEMLSENSPATKEFLQVLEDIKTKEAYDYRGQKSHTKGKKGVFGMEGRKPWLTAEENAKDFMDAQLQYAEAALKWGHLSDATREANKVLASDVDMPNAKKWAEGYIRNALGINPTKAGANLEAAINSFWEATGVGHTIPSNVVGYSRKAVNTMLLGLHPAFLATNVVQPFLSMPAMTSFLKSRGIDAMTTGYDSMAKAGFTIFKDKLGKLNELEAAAKDYADKHHVYGSELVDTSTVSRKNAEFYLDKTGNFLAGNIESSTRQLMYYGFVHMLNDNGIRDFGLANNLTDMAMNNYSPIERPTIFNALGPIGDIAANLSSFKHNELSRLAMFAREIGKEGDAKPFLMQIAVGAAAAGITGSLAFAEADWLYRQITKSMGKPDSLSRVVIDFSEKLSDDPKGKYVASHGAFSLMGLDLSKRLGVSDVVPNSLGEAMFPGGSKLVDVASQGLSTLSDPSEMNFKRLAREAAPGFATGAMDRNWFSNQTPQGELGLNRRTLEGQVIRNDADKMAKNFGFTGINESVQKQKLWDLKQQGIGYSELRAAVVNKIVDGFHTDLTREQWKSLLLNYQRYEGDEDTLVRELEPKLKAGQVSAVDVAKLLAINAKSTPQKMQGARTIESLQ